MPRKPPKPMESPIPVFTISREAAKTAVYLAEIDGVEPGELIQCLLANELGRRGLALVPAHN